MKAPWKKFVGGLTGGMVALAGLAAAPAAQAAPNSYGYSAARWLDDQLTGGIVHNEQYDFDDFGLSLDIYFALADLDARPAAQQRIIDAVSARADEYAQYEYDDVVYDAPASAAKLAVAVVQAGNDPTDVGGLDLVTLVEDNTDDATGETSDTYGGVGQAWATRGLVAADSDEAAKSVEFLLAQACDDGSFKQNYGSDCPATPNIDATVYAMFALRDASASGIDGIDTAVVDAAIAKATDVLLAAQAQNGSFESAEGANTNSTGLAATALSLVGEAGAAGSAAAWTVKHQVTDAAAEDTALARELGAIAFNTTALETGKTDGITVETRDQWIRATAQAVVGVQAQLSPTSVTVKQPANFVKPRAAVKVTASGLVAGEKYTAKISGGTSVSGTVPASGTVSVSLKAPARTANRVVTVAGSRANRSGTTTVRVLGAKKLAPKVTKAKAKRGTNNAVRVTGLDPREPVKVFYAGKKIRTGKANAKGVYRIVFKVRQKTGVKKVRVVGAFANRAGAKTFRVVK